MLAEFPAGAFDGAAVAAAFPLAGAGEAAPEAGGAAAATAFDGAAVAAAFPLAGAGVAAPETGAAAVADDAPPRLLT